MQKQHSAKMFKQTKKPNCWTTAFTASDYKMLSHSNYVNTDANNNEAKEQVCTCGKKGKLIGGICQQCYASLKKEYDILLEKCKCMPLLTTEEEIDSKYDIIMNRSNTIENGSDHAEVQANDEYSQ